MKANRLTATRHYFLLLLLLPALVVMTVGCNGSYNSGGGNAPYISGLSVASGPVGTSVTISGTNFGATQGSSTVTFNGTAATPTSWSATSIVVPVPTGATTGPLVVTVGGKTSNAVTFAVTSAATPAITSLNPTSGTVGTPVTITGTNFGATQVLSVVTFYYSKTASVTSWSATTIVVTVPSGATTGNVTVTVGGVTSNGVAFTVMPAAPASITATAGTPQSATVNTAFATQLQATVKDSGNNPVSGVTVTFTAPTSGASGTFAGGMNTATTNAQGVATAAVFTANGSVGSYTVTASVAGVSTPATFSLTNVAAAGPQINSLNPTSGAVGTSVTITGTNFGATQGTSTITFNSTTATPTSWSATSIVAPVPSSATTGNVTVTVAGATSNGVLFTVTPGPPASITASAGTPQSATVNTAFSTQLQATVKDSGNNPLSGVTVTFTAPTSGASGTFAGGMNTATTNAQGVATAAVFTANGSVGSYTVTASATGVSTPANFSLTNLASSAPTITRLNPTSGAVGTSVTITGTNFGASQGLSTVTFYNGVAATPTSWSNSSIVAPVPTGAATGNVFVTVGGVASNGVTFTVTGSSVPAFPIKLSANKRYFVDANGNPWLMVADAGHHLMPVIGSTTSSIQQYINSRVAQGFNTINVYGMCGGTGTCPPSGAAQNGASPFLSGSSSTDYDISKPNPAYWSQVDNVINLANQAGLVVLFDPVPWGVNFGTMMENTGATGGPVNYPTNDFNFGVFLGNRYKNSPNIIWQFGQDFRHGALPDQFFMDYMAQVIAGVASVDSTHLITSQMNYYVSYTQQGLQVACNTSCTTAFWNPRFGNTNNVSFVYTYYETYDEMLQAYNCTPAGTCTIQANNGTQSIGGSAGNAPLSQSPPSVMPTILGESNYEGANNTTFLSSNANAFITRQEMWYAMTSGGAGFEFGQVNVNHFDSSPSWTTMLNTTGTQQVKYVANLLNQFNWWTFVPDTTGQVVTVGAGTANPSNANLYNATHATTTWDTTSTAIIYTPVTATLTIDMARFSGPVTARWYDPTAGNFTATSCTSTSPCANSGTMNFTTPTGPHSDGTNANDWVLVLQ